MKIFLMMCFCLVICSVALSAPVSYEGYDTEVTSEDLKRDPDEHTLSPLVFRPSEMPWAYSDRRVYDYARVLSASEAGAMDLQLKGTHLTVVTMVNRDGESVLEYAERVREQFRFRIPDGCRSPPLGDWRQWETDCFIAMPEHKAELETVLVYEPIKKTIEVVGPRKKETVVLKNLTDRLKKRPYRRAFALATYAPEPPLVGPAAPWRLLVTPPRALQMPRTDDRSSIVPFFLILGAVVASGLIWHGIKGLKHVGKRPIRSVSREQLPT